MEPTYRNCNVNHPRCVYNKLRTKILFSQNINLLFNKYRGADKSLARPGMKQASFPAFYGT